jgi:hypothetical protein
MSLHENGVEREVTLTESIALHFTTSLDFYVSGIPSDRRRIQGSWRWRRRGSYVCNTAINSARRPKGVISLHMQLQRLELCREMEEFFFCLKRASIFLDEVYLYRSGVYNKSHRIYYVCSDKHLRIKLISLLLNSYLRENIVSLHYTD